jgi:hypothetical protein
MKAFLSLIVLTLAMMASGRAEAAQCSVELENGRGRIVDTFRGYGYDRQDACWEAKRECRQAIRAGYYRARILNCNVVQPRNRRIVTKSCNSSLVNPRGRTIQVFFGTASGIRGTGVKAEACQKAQRQCRRFKERNGRYRATCISERGGINYPRPIPTPRRPMPRRTIILDA